MIEITYRKSTEEETNKVLNDSLIITVWWRFFIACLLSLLLIMLCIDLRLNFVYAFISILLLILIIVKNGNSQKTFENETFDVEVTRYICERAIKLKATREYDAAYYIEVEKNKVFFIDEQLFFENDANSFPNTIFETIVQVKTGILIDFKMLGEKFEPELILDSYSEKEIENEDFPNLAEIINKSLDQIIIERQNITP